MRHFAIALLTILTFSTASLATDPSVTTVAKVSNINEVMSNISYPLISRENGVEGRVVVLVKIDEEGDIISNEVVSSPCENLSKAVNESIKDLKFVPAKNEKGEAVPTSVKIPIDFKLTID